MYGDKRRLSKALQPWATLVGLVRWANRVGPTPQPSGLASSPDQHSNVQLAPQGDNTGQLD